MIKTGDYFKMAAEMPKIGYNYASIFNFNLQIYQYSC